MSFAAQGGILEDASADNALCLQRILGFNPPQTRNPNGHDTRCDNRGPAVESNKKAQESQCVLLFKESSSLCPSLHSRSSIPLLALSEVKGDSIRHDAHATQIPSELDAAGVAQSFLP